MQNNPAYECADDVEDLDDLDAIITKRHTLRIKREHFKELEPIYTKNNDERASDIDLCASFNYSLNSLDDTYTGISDIISPRSRCRNELKIVTNELKLVPKSEWKKDAKCYVCERILDKLRRINPHHCRVCGHGVCGDCSIGTINDHRVCDVCYKKEKYKGAEKRRQQVIKELNEKEQVLQKTLKARLEKVSQAKQDFNDEVEKDINTEGNRNKVKQDRHRDIERMMKQCVKLEEQKAEKSAKFELQEAIIQEKEKKLQQLKMKLGALKLEISQKAAVLEKKVKKSKVIKNKRSYMDDTMDSVSSYVDIKGCSSPRNYSLIGNEKDGKYSLSNEPTLI